MSWSGHRLDVEQVHALFEREVLAFLADVLVAEADAVADLGYHAGTAGHDAVDHLAIDVDIRGGDAAWSRTCMCATVAPAL